MEDLTTKGILAHMNEVLKLLPGSIYLKDINGVYLACNEFQAKMAGFDSPEHIIGKTDYDLPWKSYADVITATDKRIMQSRTPQELVEKALLFDKNEIILQSIKAPLYDDNGEVMGIVGTSIDITARKQAEDRELVALAKLTAAEKKAEEEAKRAVMVLAGSIAHDLRTPLFCLRSINYILENYLPVLLEFYNSSKKTGLNIGIKPTEEEINWIKKLSDAPGDIEQYITAMHLFIDDNLKALKRSILSSLTEEDLVECKSYKGIDNALNSYPFKEEERELIQWERSYYFNFLGNPVLFMRIIFNLLSNSLYQIHKNGKGKIFISSEEQPKYNIIRFRDTGGGAPAEIVEHIFDGYSTNKKEGTGIGLAFCKLTMKSFGGDVVCHSIEGDYIEFVLTFPKIEKHIQ